MSKVTHKIIEKIKTDNDFSIELAKVLKIQQQSVIALAKRNSQKLTLYDAIKFYQEKGLSISEIIAEEK